MGTEFVIVSPPDHVAVVPFAGADLDSEGQAVGVEAAGEADGRDAQHVDPAGVAVWAFGDAAVLRHGLVNGRHLDGWIKEAVEVQAVQLAVVQVENLAAGCEEVGLGCGIVFQLYLLDAEQVAGSGLVATDDGAGDLLAGGADVVLCRVILRRAEVGEEGVGSFAEIRKSADVGGGLGEAVGEDGGIDEDGGAGGPELVDGLHKGCAGFGLEGEARFFAGGCELGRRGGGTDALEGGSAAFQNERRHGEALAPEGSGFQVVSVWPGLGLCGATDCGGVEGVFTGHDGELERGVRNVAGDGTGVVQQGVQGGNTRETDKAACGEDADE